MHDGTQPGGNTAEAASRRAEGLEVDSQKLQEKLGQASLAGSSRRLVIEPRDRAEATTLESPSPYADVTCDFGQAPAAVARLGTRFGPYELQGELARGGMGVIYRARQRELNRIVALKMILAGQLADEHLVKRFHIEAESAAALQHPGIVAIYEVGEIDGQHFFSMEFVDGTSLAEKLRDGPLRPAEAAAIVKQVAEAVHYAHGRGIVHRDLKPGNVLLQKMEDGTGNSDEGLGTPGRGKSALPHSGLPLSSSLRPRVTDFGLAKRVDGGVAAKDRKGERPEEVRRDDLTHTGQILGTPSYMPPEQAAGKRDVGPLADVYALGAILYACLTGRPPFQAPTPIDTLLAVLEREPIAPRSLQVGVPRDLDTIALKCLQKDPAKRYANAQAMADDLAHFLAGEPIRARPVGRVERAWRWCQRKPLAAALIALAAVLALTFAIGGPIVATRESRHARDLQAQIDKVNTATRARASGAVQSVLTAAPDAVPLALENLSPLADLVEPELLQVFHDERAEPSERLHAAYALARGRGEGKEVDGGMRDESRKAGSPLGYLLSRIADAPAAECRNIVLALEPRLDAVRPALLERARSESNTPAVRARYATILLHLGDVTAAVEMCEPRPDPVLRTALLHGQKDCEGDLTRLATTIRSLNKDPSSQISIPKSQASYALICGVALYPAERIRPAEKVALTELVRGLYTSAPDAATHAACYYTLKKWGEEIPAIEPAEKPTPGRQWFVTREGMTLVEVPSGEFRMGANPLHEKPSVAVEFTRPWWLSDREVTVEQFQRFINDVDYPAAQKAVEWGLSEPASPTTDCPVQQVNWIDAVLYCNWLSGQAGLTPCYTRGPEKVKIRPFVELRNGQYVRTNEIDDWRCDMTAGGYRLPTEAEWEYACRAGSVKTYCHGDDDELLSEYATWVSNAWGRTWPAGTRLPHPWGTFDLHGNVKEWCGDRRVLQIPVVANDPTLPTQFTDAMARGGGFNDAAANCRSAWGHQESPLQRWLFLGFRVALNSPAEVTPETGAEQ